MRITESPYINNKEKNPKNTKRNKISRNLCADADTKNSNTGELRIAWGEVRGGGFIDSCLIGVCMLVLILHLANCWCPVNLRHILAQG